jgi:restriction system protein
MAPAKLWFVRAGEGAASVGAFVREGYVAIGWNELGPIAATITDEELSQRFAERFPDEKDGTRRVWNAVVRRFTRELHPGDGVMTYDPERRLYFIGTLESEVTFDGARALGRIRKANWTHQLERDVLTKPTRNSLGAIVTLFQVTGDAKEEVLARAAPLGVRQSAPAAPVVAAIEPDADDVVIAEEQTRANALIEDRLLSLKWDEMQELIAGILRAMGYRTRVAPPGRDRGTDVFASRDGLGLEEPRIFVEVKHRTAKMDAPAIRAFLGGRKPGDRCLYLSTGGFTNEARYEADRAAVPLQLIDLSHLRELVLDFYEKLEPDIRAMVRLKKVWWPEG